MNDSANILWFGETNAWKALTAEKEDEDLERAVEEIEEKERELSDD